MPREFPVPYDLETYKADGRLPVETIYERLGLLFSKFGWNYVDVFSQQCTNPRGEKKYLPICLFHSPIKGPALWLIFGIHGEESAPPNAVAGEIERTGELGKRIPMVVIWGNPFGYLTDYRYPDEYRNKLLGHSVGDTEHLIPSLTNPNVAMRPRYSSPTAWYLADAVIRLSRYYPPELVVDLHEDEELDNFRPPPIFSHGVLGAKDPIAQAVHQTIHANGFHLKNDSPVFLSGDGSIDDLLAAKQIIVGGTLQPGPSAKSVVVAETPTHTAFGKPYPFETRVQAHREILEQVEKFYYQVLEMSRKGMYA